MSRRTQWRRVTERIIGLLKTFSKLLRKEGSGSVAVGLCNWLPPGSSQRGLCRHTQAHLCQAGPQSRISEGCRQPSKQQRISPEIGAQRARRSDRSHCDTLLLNSHHGQCERPRPDPQLFLSRLVLTSSSVAGGKPGKEVVMRYKRRN